MSNVVVSAYKGFNRDFTCRGFQYRVGETYEHGDAVRTCESGFHACEYPIDVFRYYAPTTSRFAAVTLSGELSRDSDDSKVAASRITIEEELQVHEMIERAIKYVFDRAEPLQNTTSDEYGAAYTTGDYGTASATGDYSVATATGERGAASATGLCGVASTTGDFSVASVSGYYGIATAKGSSGAASATGGQGVAIATGYYSAALASGHGGSALATGCGGTAYATGEYGTATATDRYGAASASGHSGVAIAAGYFGTASASGHDGSAIAIGRNSRASGKEGCALFLVERDVDGQIVNVWAGIVGRDGIKPDVFYTLRDGRPVEV